MAKRKVKQPVFEPGAPDGWTATDESIMFGNQCTAYRAVIEDLSLSIGSDDWVVGFLKQRLERLEEKQRVFKARWLRG